jgi:MoaA/NifB/PqqE/SkfB family radical SAM enzyme
MKEGIALFNDTLTEAVANNKRFLLKRAAYIPSFARIALHIGKANKLRAALADKENLVVPPVLIISVTNDCNLACAGCYACHQNRDKNVEMNMAQITRVVDEAAALGVSVVMIAGGEPFMKPDILELPKKYPQLLFVMFTNGLLLTGDTASAVGKLKNLVPVLSLEGGLLLTDARRGAGVYDAVKSVMRDLDENKQLFGVSVTLTSVNYDEVVRSDYLKTMQDTGCRAAFLIEYVPCGAEDLSLCLTDEQKEHLRAVEKDLYKQHDMLVVSLPGNEDPYGGCLASGRGFLHISANGALEACPFAPYSDTSVKDMPLKQALQSRLIAEVRDNHDKLKESRGGCALKENAEWVKALQMKIT